MPSNRFLSAALVAAALILPSAALAQQQPAPAQPGQAVPGAHHRHRGAGWQRALRGLNLTSQQQDQIRNAVAQNRQANRNADRQTRRANAQKLRATIEGILTPAQRTQFEQNLAQMRQHRGQARATQPVPGTAATPLP